MNLIPIESINKNIIIDLRYSTTNNFTKTKLYSSSTCLLKNEVAIALDKVQKELEEKGLSLIIWDAYRSQEVQDILRKHFNDPNFVSQVSNHSKGISVDVSLCKKNGEQIPMPTDFDDFSIKAKSDYPHLSPEQINNRNILKTTMEKHRFKQDNLEWWHFDFAKI